MKLTKPAIILILWIVIFGLAEELGPVDAAAYVFLFLSAFFIYKYIKFHFIKE